jgi:hypothetical protein
MKPWSLQTRLSPSFAHSSIASAILLIATYYLVAAASFNGFYDKWGFRDGLPRFALVDLIDGTAHRPFVYRQLVRAIANAAEAMLGAKLQETVYRALLNEDGRFKIKFLPRLNGDPVKVLPQYVIRYHIV